MQRKVFSFNSGLYKITGVQKVMMVVLHVGKGDYNDKFE